MLLSVSACHPYSMFKLEPIQAANQQNYWLQLSPVRECYAYHSIYGDKQKKERKELRSIVSYDNNMTCGSPRRSIVCTYLCSTLLHSFGPPESMYHTICTILVDYSCMVPPHTDW